VLHPPSDNPTSGALPTIQRADRATIQRGDRWRLAIAILMVVPAGFATKFALPQWLGGALGRWCLLYGAAVLYEVFWVLVLCMIWPRMAPWRSAAVVFAATCALEYFQLVHTPWLHEIRRTYIGAALLGNGFDWMDFPHYAIGSAAGALLAYGLRQRTPRALSA
jgi:hypothetical protein